jgi:hypothetical protein
MTILWYTVAIRELKFTNTINFLWQSLLIMCGYTRRIESEIPSDCLPYSQVNVLVFMICSSWLWFSLSHDRFLPNPCTSSVMLQYDVTFLKYWQSRKINPPKITVCGVSGNSYIFRYGINLTLHLDEPVGVNTISNFNYTGTPSLYKILKLFLKGKLHQNKHSTKEKRKGRWKIMEICLRPLEVLRNLMKSKQKDWIVFVYCNLAISEIYLKLNKCIMRGIGKGTSLCYPRTPLSKERNLNAF